MREEFPLAVYKDVCTPICLDAKIRLLDVNGFNNSCAWQLSAYSPTIDDNLYTIDWICPPAFLDTTQLLYDAKPIYAYSHGYRSPPTSLIDLAAPAKER